MSVPEVRLTRLDHLGAEEVLLQIGETFLGRGPLLKIDATNISRKHARLNICEPGDEKESGSVLITCTHKNPIYVKSQSQGAWSELLHGKTVALNNLDEIKFLEDCFHFQVRFTECPEVSKPLTPPPTSPEPHVVITPKPTGLMVERNKRKLPNWMTESESPAKKKKTPPRDKAPTSDEIYDQNVKLVNSSLEDQRTKAENNFEESKSGLDTPGPSHVFQSDQEKPNPWISDEEEDETEADKESRKVETEADKENRKVETETNKDCATKKEAPRASCLYGASCYRKNPLHRREESHPGDVDYQDPAAHQGEEDENKPECEYGLDCYRKNPQHRKDYKHTRKALPKREVKVKKPAKKKTKDDYDSDDSFIDDEEEDGWEPVDDSDDDADYKAPADVSSELEYDDPDVSSEQE